MSEKILLDQYGERVPDDLVFLDSPADLVSAILKAIDKLTWYNVPNRTTFPAVSKTAFKTALSEIVDDLYTPPEPATIRVSPYLHDWLKSDEEYET